MKILATVQETRLTVTIEFDGDRVTGRWDNDQGQGAIAVVRREPSPPLSA